MAFGLQESTFSPIATWERDLLHNVFLCICIYIWCVCFSAYVYIWCVCFSVYVYIYLYVRICSLHIMWFSIYVYIENHIMHREKIPTYACKYTHTWNALSSNLQPLTCDLSWSEWSYVYKNVFSLYRMCSLYLECVLSIWNALSSNLQPLTFNRSWSEWSI